MAKRVPAFSMPAEDQSEVTQTSDVEAASESTSTADVALEASKAVPATRPAYRQDRRNLSVWLDRKAFNTFKAMVAEEGGTIQDYVVDMINREFARKGRPLIAK